MSTSMTFLICNTFRFYILRLQHHILKILIRISHVILTILLEIILIELSVRPRNMTVEHQRKSLHYFHSYAVLNRIDFCGLSSDKPVGVISDLTLSS